MKILVRLPNWLGDMVMAVGLLQQLPQTFPQAQVSVVVKKGLEGLLPYFLPVQQQYVFSKEEHPGFRGPWRFGRSLRKAERFDLYLSLPDSFSSALMGYAAGAKHRIGYRKEGRDLLLTHSYAKPAGLHRVEEYIHLLSAYTGKPTQPAEVRLPHNFHKQDYIVVNINSEASSRRLTVAKAVEIISAVRLTLPQRIVLIGGPREAAFVESVMAQLPDRSRIESLAGKTSLEELVGMLASAQAMLSTDSGPAHLANALGTHTVVLFGAGNENNTAPYQKEHRQVLRLGKLSCEPCTKNVCVQFGTPQCLELLETETILAALSQTTLHER